MTKWAICIRKIVNDRSLVALLDIGKFFPHQLPEIARSHFSGYGGHAGRCSSGRRDFCGCGRRRCFFAQAEIDDTNHAANNARAMITSDFLNISFCLISGKISEYHTRPRSRKAEGIRATIRTEISAIRNVRMTPRHNLTDPGTCQLPSCNLSYAAIYRTPDAQGKQSGDGRAYPCCNPGLQASS